MDSYGFHGIVIVPKVCRKLVVSRGGVFWLQFWIVQLMKGSFVSLEEVHSRGD